MKYKSSSILLYCWLLTKNQIQKYDDFHVIFFPRQVIETLGNFFIPIFNLKISLCPIFFSKRVGYFCDVAQAAIIHKMIYPNLAETLNPKPIFPISGKKKKKLIC